MKKVLILYAAYGGGHYSAAKSIKKCLDDNYDVETEIIDCIEYINKVLNRVTTGAYKEMAKKAPNLWGKVYSNSQKGLLGHVSSRTNKMMAIKLKNLIKEKNPDLVISTHPFSSQMVSYLKRKQKIFCRLVTVLTDFASHEQWLIGHEYTDGFFVSNNKMKDELIQYGVESNKVHVTGIPLSDRFFEQFDKEKIFNEFNLDSSKPVILFFGGGEFGLGKDRTLEVLESIINNFSIYQIVAISGKNKKMNIAFHELVDKLDVSDRAKILSYTTKVPELMSISCLVVTKPGGLTTSESLASNLPLLIINPIPGQEEENAEFLEEHNVAVWLRNNENPNKVIHKLLKDPNKLEEMKKNAMNLAKKNSTQDICKIIINEII